MALIKLIIPSPGEYPPDLMCFSHFIGFLNPPSFFLSVFSPLTFTFLSLSLHFLTLYLIHSFRLHSCLLSSQLKGAICKNWILVEFIHTRLLLLTVAAIIELAQLAVHLAVRTGRLGKCWYLHHLHRGFGPGETVEHLFIVLQNISHWTCIDADGTNKHAGHSH